jgi:hypothetical protein
LVLCVSPIPLSRVSLTISDKVSSSKSIKDEDLKALIGKPLRESKKSKKSKAAAAETKA